MPDTNIHGRSGSGRRPCSPACAARPIRHETHLAVCVHPTPARDPTSAKGRRREAGHLANPDVTLDAGRRSWSKEPDVDRSKRQHGCRNPFPQGRCPRRLVLTSPSSTGISPMAQATPVSRRCALWPRPSSSSLRRPGPAHACPSHDGATFMRDAPTSWTPSPSRVRAASADGQRYPFRSVPLRARLDAWSTALRNVPPR
jgi:hypothetical protein